MTKQDNAIDSKIEEVFFKNFEQEKCLIEEALTCDTHIKYLTLVSKYGEETINGVFSARLRTDIHTDQVFNALKAVTAPVDFI